MKKVILWKLLIVIFVIHLPVRIYAAVGGISTVDSAGDAGKYNSLVLDSSGNPHISYHAVGSGLRYTHYNGSSWEIETVDSAGDVGPYTTIAFDSTGNPHISYHDESNSDLKYAHFNGISWEIETVDRC